MARRGLLVLILSGLTALSGCGKKGPIEPPLARIPQTVGDLAALQKGRQVWLRWTNPESYVDGSPIADLTGVEVWLAQEDRAARSAAAKWTEEEFEDKAGLLTRIPADQFDALRSREDTGAGLVYVYVPKEEDFGRLVLAFSLRIRERRNRVSAFSDVVSLDLLAPPLPPQKVTAEVFEDQIRIRWEAAVDPGAAAASSRLSGFNLYRSEEEQPSRQLNTALIRTTEYSDKDFSFGRTYRYSVRAVLEAASSVESEDSVPIGVLARDTFPPAPPAGLSVIGGPGFIALSWEANTEPDLGGYKVWRRTFGRGEFVPIAELTASESAFQDTEVEKKRRYEYAISAFDTAGNESRMSEPAGGIIRDTVP